jgi:hypothetical protein
VVKTAIGLAMARKDLADGILESAIQAAQAAEAGFPDSLAPKIIMAVAYHRKGGMMDETERVFGAAIRALPRDDKTAWVALYEAAASIGHAEMLEAIWHADIGTNPLAAEMAALLDELKMARTKSVPKPPVPPWLLAVLGIAVAVAAILLALLFLGKLRITVPSDMPE